MGNIGLIVHCVKRRPEKFYITRLPSHFDGKYFLQIKNSLRLLKPGVQSNEFKLCQVGLEENTVTTTGKTSL
jgi:hypothetical protein